MGHGHQEDANKTTRDVGQEWDKSAGSWDKGFMGQAVKRFNKLAGDVVKKEVLDKVFNQKKVRMLDFGAGTGLLSAELSPYCSDIVAVEASSKMGKRIEEIAKENNISKVWCGDICDGFDEPPSSFDLVVSGSVLTFVPDLPKALTRMTELMKPGAYAVHFVWENFDKNDRTARDKGRAEKLSYMNGISQTQLQAEMEHAGLKVETFGMINVKIHWLIPFWGMKWRYVVAKKE